MEDKIIITREKREIERFLAEGHEHIATRNGIEYVFRLKLEEEVKVADDGPQTTDGLRSPVIGRLERKRR